MVLVPDGSAPAAVQPHQILSECCSLQDGARTIPAATAGILDAGPLDRRKGREVAIPGEVDFCWVSEGSTAHTLVGARGHVKV